MKNFGLLALTLICLSQSAWSLTGSPTPADGQFPKMPHLDMTPGLLCTTPDAKRYPEQIDYCNRAVDTYTKDDIIRKYDATFGYSIESMNRNDFKIDHLIPLCAGGANDERNLWPQHKSVYAITDPVEPLICAKMQKGTLKQAQAVQLVIFAKTHLDQVPQVLAQLNSL